MMQDTYKHHSHPNFASKRWGVIICMMMLVLPSILLAITPTSNRKAAANVKIRPTIATANRASGNRVFVDNAELLRKAQNDTFLWLVGDVRFSKGPMLMFCDSAQYFPESESLNAFGNVRMEQGDTLFVFADELNYDGPSELAILYADDGKKVRLINRDVKLETNEFFYDLAIDLCYYNSFGVLTDKQNRLQSEEGEYIPATKEASFYWNVKLNSKSDKDSLEILTDSLYYNTATHMAEIYSQSIISNRQAKIYTREGFYNTEIDTALMLSHSKIVTRQRGSTLEGDTLFYDRQKGYGEAFGRVEIVDTLRKVTLNGDYGFYNELTDSAFVRGRRALAKEFSRGDTLYLHSKRIYTFAKIDSIITPADTVAGIMESLRLDTLHTVVATPGVRFYRSDIQGVCDSMRFEQRDSMLYMFVDPVVWSSDRQIFGNQINLHLNDSTIDRAVLPDFGFTAQHIEGEYYNQLSGKEMKAYFEGENLRRLEVNGNVEAILLPEENDSTINKIINAESSFLEAEFTDKDIERLKMWPETSGTVTPLYLSKPSQLKLPKFQWFEALRPTDPDDVFRNKDSQPGAIGEGENNQAGEVLVIESNATESTKASPALEVNMDADEEDEETPIS